MKKTPAPTPSKSGITVKELPPLLTIKAVSENFGIGRTTIWELTSSGKIKSITIGDSKAKCAKRLIITKTLIEYVESQLEEAEKRQSEKQ